MFEIFALVIYSVQWLGVVLGVGAEVVLLLAHLMALHDKRPTWLDSIPAVRMVQFISLMFIVGSGVAAVLYQILIGQPGLLLAPVFDFKWLLIIALVFAYMLEKNAMHGHAALEGFTGATWLALFMVHSVAPVAPWLGLILFYTAWMVVFGVVWGAFVLFMKYTGGSISINITLPSLPKAAKPAPAPAMPVAKPVPPPAPRPAFKPAPAAVPVPVAAFVAPPPPPPAPKPIPPPPPKPVATPPPPPPKPAPVVIAAKPPNLPAVEPLELMAPHVISGPARPAPYMPDYNSLPGLSVMPQRPEDLHLQNRGPVVQPA